MGYSKRDYMVTIEHVLNNEARIIGIEPLYKILIVRNCATLHEVSQKIYDKCKHLKKSDWEIVLIERLKANMEIID